MSDSKAKFVLLLLIALIFGPFIGFLLISTTGSLAAVILGLVLTDFICSLLFYLWSKNIREVIALFFTILVLAPLSAIFILYLLHAQFL